MSLPSIYRAHLALALSCLALSCADLGADARGEVLAQAAEATRSTLELPVVLRETGSATIHATIFESSRVTCGKTILAVHGLSETGTTYEPLARALFDDPTVGARVQRVIAIDLVGHGKSSLPRDLPEGVRFGDLTIHDNVSVIRQALDALRQKNLAPSILVGHSMGGLAVQALQESLLASGSSLARRGIEHAVLLAPVPAHGLQWTQPPATDTSAFVAQDPALGAFFALPPAVWIAQAFTSTKGVQAPNAPSVAEVTERGYSAREPLATLLQLIEAPVPLPDGKTLTLARPAVRAGAFAPAQGTRLTLVGFSEDVLLPAGDLDDLAAHLTGAQGAYVGVTSDDAVHSMFLSNPSAVLEALRTSLH